MNLIGGGSSDVTAITGDTATVYLYNLNNTMERNLVSVLADSNEVDSSVMVSEAKDALVSVPKMTTRSLSRRGLRFDDISRGFQEIRFP